MHCQNCGTPLSADLRFCPNCGTAAPQNISQPSPLDPTLAVSPNEPAPIDPTVLASPYQPSPLPPTSYGPPPPPPSSNSPVPDPYAAGYNPSGQQIPHGYNPTPMPPTPNSYQPNFYQQSTPAPNYHQAQPFPTPPVTPPRKNRLGLIIGITATVLVVALCGLLAYGANLASKSTTSDSTTTTQRSDTSTPNTENTPTPTASMTSSTTPSGNPIDPTAASIITDAQTASSINQITAAPINLTNTLQAKTDIYVTFKLNNDNFDFSKNTGYVNVKFYADSTALDVSSTPLTISEPAPGGFFKVQYLTATQQGAAELYWCLQPDCSDEQLAQVVTFTVTS